MKRGKKIFQQKKKKKKKNIATTKRKRGCKIIHIEQELISKPFIH